MTLTAETFLIVCPLVFLAGFIDSVAGGGGLISLPAYYLAGLPPVLAQGTNKLSAGVGTAASLGRFVAGGKVVWRTGLMAALGAFPGSWLGTMVLRSIDGSAVKVMMIAVIPLVALVVLRRRGPGTGHSLVPARLHAAAAVAIGLVIGFYDGLVGPGTGTFLIILFTSLLGMEAVMASGTAKVVNLTSNVSALMSLLLSGEVLISLGLPAALCGIAGNWLGAGLAVRGGEKVVRTVLLLVLALLLAKMVLDVV